jgi:hypothetical protein
MHPCTTASKNLTVHSSCTVITLHPSERTDGPHAVGRGNQQRSSSAQPGGGRPTCCAVLHVATRNSGVLYPAWRSQAEHSRRQLLQVALVLSGGHEDLCHNRQRSSSDPAATSPTSHAVPSGVRTAVRLKALEQLLPQPAAAAHEKRTSNRMRHQWRDGAPHACSARAARWCRGTAPRSAVLHPPAAAGSKWARRAGPRRPCARRSMEGGCRATRIAKETWYRPHAVRQPEGAPHCLRSVNAWLDPMCVAARCNHLWKPTQAGLPLARQLAVGSVRSLARQSGADSKVGVHQTTGTIQTTATTLRAPYYRHHTTASH